MGLRGHLEVTGASFVSGEVTWGAVVGLGGHLWVSCGSGCHMGAVVGLGDRLWVT